MTKVITRYFESAERARSVEREMLREKFSRRIIHIYTDADTLVDTLVARRVDPATAEAYQRRVADGGAVLLVEAGYKPLGVAKTTRDLTAKMGAVPLGNLPEEVTVKDTRSKKISVLTDHRHFLLRERNPYNTNYHMADWPIPLISRRKPYRDMLIDPHARMAAWPLPLTFRRNPRDSFAFPRHARMANFILPLTIRRKPSDSFAFPRHARMANFPLPLISRRKPFDKVAFPRHQRMANWPFPLLINGETGKNAIIPGSPHMANYPIPLISDRKPADKFAFPRHARMADILLPLLSKREPADKFAFPRHARMADKILPLVTKHGASSRKGGFSFSKMLGLPTLIRR
ncbi:PucR family transcriptional regulator [Cognatishimia sp. F0-27]|uniref:PucR family transcriptional regulator n=1 Tax=Cognatishimia sp. F0-27 TaxID=2816855 RepID=UPI001D0C0528|nr:PucR family transcriptional regulator [Cognatishimia sp. F0-27]MCC1493183.1 PucR family transcriptional regulator [Cognatishimia sp. F0-27]